MFNLRHLRASTAACPQHEKQAFIVLKLCLCVCVCVCDQRSDVLNVAIMGCLGFLCLSVYAYDEHYVSVWMIYECLCVLNLCIGSLYRMTQLYFMCFSRLSKVFMCLLKSSRNVKKTSAVFKSWVWMCLKPQHIVKDIVTWLLSLFSA